MRTMKNMTVKMVYLLAVSLITVLGLYACAGKTSMAKMHPVEVTGMPVCGDCHTDWRASLSHTEGYILRHKFQAAQNSQTCSVCHKAAFCSDCHANKEELKPSDKYKDAPGRSLPHRGDYLNQHRIDGRINPASCLKCHGRSNNERCKVCHR